MSFARSPVALLLSLWGELPGLLEDRLELLMLDLRRARQTLVQVLALAVAAVLFALIAWIACWTGITLALIALGLPSSLAAFVVAVANAAAMLWSLLRVRRLFPLLGLPAIRRHLRLDPQPGDAAPGRAQRGAAP